MAKVRVSELAKEYGVKSAEVITMLTDLGEYVKAPSSSVEPPVVKRFQDKYGEELLAKRDAAAAKKAAKKAPAKKAAPAAEAPTVDVEAPAAAAEAPAEAPARGPRRGG